MKRFLRATTVTILLFMAALGASSSPALASDLKSPTQGASLSWGFTSEKFANRPRHIAGYTIHAKLRMSERDIGEKEVNALVRFGPEGINQGDGTWKIMEADTPFAVVINGSGWVVTVHPVI
ncbi:DUF4258 domain-containing protein [Pseudonocardia sp. ICBG1142]|uniref:DUF4258 domain-containing protein n=1 Tax=Pseudonocardia sp. ICBG1142 TaxID=2846760 RepID=UPI001CF6DC43|nr:DUF4258 domain-containing protein [Pseudonocardia sp. ICBG1142]